MKRPIRIEGDIAYIPLTKGYEAVIDAADVPLVDGFDWCAHPQKRTTYAQRKDRTGAKPRTVYLHRAIMGEPAVLHVDHVDGDGLHNRRANLRTVTHAQNQHNAKLRSDNCSGRKGVSKVGNKWVANICVAKKRSRLGAFKCPTAAHFAYVKASQSLHGEFGRIV